MVAGSQLRMPSLDSVPPLKKGSLDGLEGSHQHVSVRWCSAPSELGFRDKALERASAVAGALPSHMAAFTVFILWPRPSSSSLMRLRVPLCSLRTAAFGPHSPAQQSPFMYLQCLLGCRQRIVLSL